MNKDFCPGGWRCAAVLCLLVALFIGGCGPEPAPSPPPPTEVVLVPTATPQPSDTPAPTEPPPPTDTATPEPTPTPEPPPARAAVFEDAPCPFELPEGQVEGETVDCGYLVVPEDRADPDSPDIRLAVGIFHPPGGALEPDPILYLAGGPGFSDLEYIWLMFDPVFAPLLEASRDLVIFDQRGMGFSEPTLDCPQLLELDLDLLDNEVDGEQLTRREADELVLETTLACGEELGRSADLAAYNTAASADDVDDLRQALGYEAVNLWGASYGTRLALEVMRDYPDGLRSVVLDSVYPLDVDLYVEGPANADRAFEVLFADCAADDACSAAYPDLRTLFFDTVDRLRDTPANFQVTHAFSGEGYDAVMDGDGLASMVFGFLKMTDVLPLVPQIIDDASQDRFDRLASILGVLMALEDAASYGMHYSVLCHDEYPFTEPEAFEAALAEYPEWAGMFEGSPVGGLGLQICAGWEAGEADAAENQAVASDIPTLILAGSYDATTPPAWGRHAGETLPNSTFFEFPGVGHAASGAPGCPQDLMLAFFADPGAPPDDACLAEMGPPSFVLPGEVGEVELEPYTNEDMGISGLIPAGWSEIDLGVYARGSDPTDATTLLAQAAPMSADDLLALVSEQLRLAAPPDPAGEREANGIAWTLYALEVQGMPFDMALADSSGLGLLVLLQSAAAEHEALYKAVFLPVVDALVPLAQPAVATADAFMAAVQEADYAAAYDLCAPDLQAEFGTAEDLGEWMQANGIEPQRWVFLSRSAEGDMVQLVGNASFPGDQELPLEMVMVEVDGEWFVAGFHVG